MSLKALIFDCDGVLVDTERDGHRVAFNQAFREFGLSLHWNIALYGRLLKQVAGGKERLQQYFDEVGWPAGAELDRAAYVERLHAHKSIIFRELVRNGVLAPRPGVARLMDEAHAAGVRLGVCTTARESSVLAVLELFGAERKDRVEHVLAGDIVARKKPDPAVYLLAAERFGLDPAECMVVEDSHIGLTAALGAGMNCIVTPSAYTADEDFDGALRVVPELGDPPGVRVDLAGLQALCAAG
jgi:HAD superfamily hydrolase (TIGR01509 family)